MNLFAGDYKAENIGQSYGEEIQCCDIYTPTFFNCGTNPTESSYIRKVKHFHKKNMGIDQETAEKLYLSKIKTLPFYPYKMYHRIETNGHLVSVGLTPKGLYLLGDGETDKFIEPDILAEYLWTEVRYCTRKKHKLRVGVFCKTKMDELVLKARCTDAEKLADRISKDVSKFRDGLLTRASPCPKKTDRRACGHCSEATRKTSRIGPNRKISDFTLSLENSFKKLRERSWTGSSTNDPPDY